MRVTTAETTLYQHQHQQQQRPVPSTTTTISGGTQGWARFESASLTSLGSGARASLDTHALTALRPHHSLPSLVQPPIHHIALSRCIPDKFPRSLDDKLTLCRVWVEACAEQRSISRTIRAGARMRRVATSADQTGRASIDFPAHKPRLDYCVGMCAVRCACWGVARSEHRTMSTNSLLTHSSQTTPAHSFIPPRMSKVKAT